ncbi:hypothetical protein V8F20_003531 [Naviculisporaceae sp. PSN 640]
MTGSGDHLKGVHSAADYSFHNPPPEASVKNILENSPPKLARGTEIRFLPKEIEHDLDEFPGLPQEFVREVLATSWEYARCVIPSYTNWDRYVAFMRIVTIGILVEVDSSLVDILDENFRCGGQSIDEILHVLFGGTPGEDAEMGRDYWTFLVTTAEKTGDRKNSTLFYHYVSALAESPRSWFRIRDADALARFTAAAALTCNDVVSPHLWFNEAQWKILSELAVTLYDSVAFIKHRAEGETNSTFAYVPPSIRTEANRQAREVLWALDTMWLDKSPGSMETEERNSRIAVANFVRFIGGPIHLLMRRYRFIEDGLKVGKEEDDEVLRQTKEHFKLWNRVDVEGGHHDEGNGVVNGDHGALNGKSNGYESGEKQAGRAKYKYILENRDKYLFEGLAELLELQGTDISRCGDCRYRKSYGSEGLGHFGGVELCSVCQEGWKLYIKSLPRRAVKAFPELRETSLRVD